MNVLIVGLVKNPQLLRLIEEGKKRGHAITGCYPSELTVYGDKDNYECTLREKTFAYYDVIYLWSVGKRRWEWYSAVDVVHKEYGTKIVNNVVIDPSENYSPTPLISFQKQTENHLPYPASALIFSANSIDSVVEKFTFPVIVKASTTHQGKGVFLANSKVEIKDIINKNKDMSPSFIIREFIPNDGDIRVFTIGYKAIGAMKRIPTAKGEFRSNISVGGRGEVFNLEKYPEVRELAEKISEITKTEIAGVDIMLNKETGKPYILEINPGPQFTGFEKYTGVNVAEEMIKYFESLIK